MIDASSPLFFVLAFYRFVCIENPPRFIADHKRFFKTRNIPSRIYISENGINGQMSGSKEDAEEYMKWMHANPLFEDLYFKIAGRPTNQTQLNNMHQNSTQQHTPKVN